MVDRRALGAIVFSNPDQRRWLEQLVHPIVRQRFDQELMHLDATACGGADDSAAV